MKHMVYVKVTVTATVTNVNIIEKLAFHTGGIIQTSCIFKQQFICFMLFKLFENMIFTTLTCTVCTYVRLHLCVSYICTD